MSNYGYVPVSAPWQTTGADNTGTSSSPGGNAAYSAMMAEFGK